MIETLKGYYSSRPIVFILALAFVVRLIAAIFSQGYAMHDDHFLIIESSSSWAADNDYNNWLPSTQQKLVDAGYKDELKPEGHSFVYPGVHYLLFEAMNAIGFENPKYQMFVIRLLHAFLGLWTVWLSMRLTRYLSDEKNIILVGWAAALGWAFAFLSVRNLVEIVCVPFLLQALLYFFKSKKEHLLRFAILSGVFIAITIAIRYQLFIYFGVFGLVLIIQGNWKTAIWILTGFIFGFGLLQGVLDFVIWGYPFAEMIEYFAYNMSDARFDYAEDLTRTYGLNYIVILMIITLPIAGIFWFFGFFVQWRKNIILVVPTLAFLVVHMIYVNTQERFIFPMIPMFLILGIIGWNSFRQSSVFWRNKHRLWSRLLQVSWGINIVLLIFSSTYYGKKSRVESAYLLYENSTYNFAILENTVDGYEPMIPKFYSGNWDFTFLQVGVGEDYAKFHDLLKDESFLVYFYGENNLEGRLAHVTREFGELEYVNRFKSSFVDRIIQWINPVNRNDVIVVFSRKRMK